MHLRRFAFFYRAVNTIKTDGERIEHVMLMTPPSPQICVFVIYMERITVSFSKTKKLIDYIYR